MPKASSGHLRSRMGRILAAFQARPFRPAQLLLLLAWAVVIAVPAAASWSLLFPAPAEPFQITAEEPVNRGAFPVLAEGRISINEASLTDLQRASGVGPVLAQAIVDAREEIGGFRFWEELLDVSGIGQKRLDALAEYFYCPFDP